MRGAAYGIRNVRIGLSPPLKVELQREKVTYAELMGKLADTGDMDSEPNIRNKISRGKFTAVFLVQCLTAIGISLLHLSA